MENNVEKKKVGAGIITMSVLYLIGQAFAIIGSISNFFTKDVTNKILADAGMGIQITTSQIVITLTTSLIITIAVILILLKKSIGACLFIGIVVLSLIYSAIVSGVSLFTPLSLIFPGLMIFFIYKKKDIYFVKQ